MPKSRRAASGWTAACSPVCRVPIFTRSTSVVSPATTTSSPRSPPSSAITTGVSSVTMKVRNGDGSPRWSRGSAPTVS